MRLLVSGGGTGGHVYPALSVIESLRRAEPTAGSLSTDSEPSASTRTVEQLDLLWVGSRGGLEEAMVKSEGVHFLGLAAGGVHGVGPWTALRNGARTAGSVPAAFGIVRRFRPDVALVTGGYACVPVTIAARASRVPVLIYLPDVVPGMAVRVLSRLAALVAVTCVDSVPHLPGRRVVVTGYPVRSDIWSMSRARARQLLALDPALPTLLVFGGSRGARSINQALVSGLRELLRSCQIVHASGTLDAERVKDATATLPAGLQSRYQHHVYLSNMPAALVAADLAVARAGAATMGEFPAAGLPAVLVPYPHSGRHQEHNARFMARHGAAAVLADSELQEKLVATVTALLADPKALGEMRAAATSLSRPDAAAVLADQAYRLARSASRRGTRGLT